MNLKIKYNKQGEILSFIRSNILGKEKYLKATPEEVIRQEFVCNLVNNYGYSIDQMDEGNLFISYSRGQGKTKVDLVIWKTKEERLSKKVAFLVVEFKVSFLNFNIENYNNSYNYNTWSKAKFFAISDGKELKIYKTIEEKIPLNLLMVNDIPYAVDILNDSKIESFLNKTKEFTGNEFSKILQKCHNIIRNNDKLSPESAFDEISKILFIKIMYERKPKYELIFSFEQFKRLKIEYLNKLKIEKENEIKWLEKQKTKKVKEGNMKDADEYDKEINNIKNREDLSYIHALFEEVKEEFKDNNIFDSYEKINLREISFQQIVQELQIYNLTKTSSDVKGIAFEKFLGKTLRGELGQFFTPRTIVNFMVDILDPKEGELICDPSCGSGGFLIKTFEKIKGEIEKEFALKRQNEQIEIFGDNLEKFEDKELNQIYDKYLERLNMEEEKRITTLCHNYIFGVDANPRMARVSKMNMIMHGDGHNCIYHHDGLLNIENIEEGKFDVIIANPPFGSRVPKDLKIEGTDTYIVNLFDVGNYSTLTEVLFLERNLKLLKSGGRMGVILPEGVLNNSNLQKVRDYFEGKAKILFITSIPQDVFVASGANVKSSIIFLKKFTFDEEKEYKSISEKVKKEVSEEFDGLISLKTLEYKKSKDKELKIEIDDLENKKEEKIKKMIKLRFNYKIAIAEVSKAGISTTGAIIENELEPLVKEFLEYRKQNNLW